MTKKGRTLYVDEETYQVLKELADRLKLSTSSTLRLLLQNNLPVIREFIQSLQQTSLLQDYRNQQLQQTEVTGTIEATMPLSKINREKNKAKESENRETTKKEKEDDKLANRPVGRDYKKFFAEKFGIPYPPEEE